jgi:hypothetical protein
MALVFEKKGNRQLAISDFPAQMMALLGASPLFQRASTVSAVRR